MDAQRKSGARALRRLRSTRGWSWTDLARELRAQARTLQITRIADAQLTSIRRAIARWESGVAVPDEQYQLLLGCAYARTPLDAVALGPGSDFQELIEALAILGVNEQQLADLRTSTAAAISDSGMGLLAFLGTPLRAELNKALACPHQLDLSVLQGLAAASDAVNEQIGSVPFVRLHLASVPIVDACRYLLHAEQPAPVRTKLQASRRQHLRSGRAVGL